MTTNTNNGWLIVTGLIALSLVPVAAGAFRLAQLGGGAEITPENVRFFAAPLPAVLHILSASIYCVLGAFQFSPGIRRWRPGWHRGAGWLLVSLGLVAALSGLWLTQFYPPCRPRRTASLCHPADGGVGDGPVHMPRPCRHPAARHPAPPCLDDARLCNRPGCGHAGVYSSALFPVRRHAG